jgi:hypothetical protein
VEQKQVVEVDFAVLSDGALVEMIEDPADATKTLFAVYRNQSVDYAPSVEDRGRILVPLPRADEDLRHVRLAQGARRYGPILDLIKMVGHILLQCLDLQPDSLVLLTAGAICTWFPEKMSVAPYLAFVGPPGSGKTTAMRLLNLLCYRGLLTADITSSAFYEISHRIRPTILLDETLTAGNPRELIHLLKASSTRDCVSLRKGKARLAFGPKVFSWLELPDDRALNSRCLIVPMRKTSRTDLISVDAPEVLEAARKARMCLLQYRFERFTNISVPKVPSAAKLSGRPLDLYRALALPFDQEQMMCDDLAPLIAQQETSQMHVLSPAQASVLRVLYVYIHKHPDAPGYFLKALAADVNSDLASRGEASKVNERKLGDILTSLSFTNRTRKNTGYVVWLERADREGLHESALEYGVAEIGADLLVKCELCAQANAPSITSAQAGPKMEAKAPSQDLKSEGRERRERPTLGMRLRVHSSNRRRGGGVS